ncbi:uncharacterized protein LOC131031094 [Cryptomeria japonica]|uniref:uncharacterized protein LOC131031094 n=1 Tax=Cryptomeria japonica TaxID=3369 RepID=UPI0027D9E37B|nr:uncharacterized protein LOC131031094 [Cryptomeria japonica]
MLDCGAHALSQNQDKQTALHVAFAHIKEEDKIEKVLKILLDRCDAKEQLVNAEDGGGKTVLHLASSRGKGKMCRLLLENGAKPDAKDNCDRLPLHYAVEENKGEVIDLLIGRNESDQETIHTVQSCKDKDGKTPLDIGAGQKNIKLLTKILPILDQPPEVYFDSVDHGKLLRHFALEGKTDLVSKLLERGVSLLDVDEEGKIALHYAAMCEDDFGTTDTVDLLLKCKDRKKLISICDNKGKTALHVIAYKGYSSLEDKVFADLQNLVDIKDREGRNSLYDATEGKSDVSDTIHVIVSMMEKKGITLDDMIDHKGLTPLHVAASQGKVFQSDVLLRRSKHPKIYVKVKDYKGQTALHKAAEGGHVDTIKVLFHWGAQPLLERDWQGKTALHYAVQSKSGEDRKYLVELLLKKCGSEERQLLFLRMSAESLGTAEKNLSDCPLLRHKMEELTKKDVNLLRTAARLGLTEMSKQLLIEGAKIEDLDYGDWYRSISDEERVNARKVRRKIVRSPVQANDQPSVEDYLGRADFAYGIAALLLNPYVEPPIAIGICGSWGMGKSSLMGQTEIILLKTAAQSALLPTFKSSEIEGVEDLMLSEKGQKIYEEIQRWVTSLWLDSNVFEYFLEWMKTIPLRFKNRILCRKRKDPRLGKRRDDVVEFLDMDGSPLGSIFKSLAAMDRSCMFTRKGQRYHSTIITVHAIITVQYNAWKYRNESEALAGLAVEITKEMEGLMTEAQWLSTCWRSQKQTILINVIFPCLLAIFLAGTIAWILWVVLDIFNFKDVVELKYASLPATIVIMAWSVGKSVMSTLNPVSTQLLNYMKLPDHTDKLGYQERVISDITFLKGEIRRKPFILCAAASCIWHFITSCCFILYLWPKFFQQIMSNRKATSTYTSDGNDDPRIIVFVDDLDRCQESVILQVTKVLVS